jgi:hypothetical protein
MTSKRPCHTSGSSPRTLTPDVRGPSQSTQFEIPSGQSGTGTDLSPNSISPPMLRIYISSIYYQQFSDISPSDRSMALGSTQPLLKMSSRNIPGGKSGRCVRLTTSPPLRAECHEIWEPKPPGTLWAKPGLLRDSFTTKSYTIFASDSALEQNTTLSLSPISQLRFDSDRHLSEILRGVWS